MNYKILSSEKNIAVFWSKNLNLSLSEKVRDDIKKGYEGTFDTPVSEIDKYEFISGYNPIINSFLKTWNEVFPNKKITNPTIELSWNRNYKKGDECLIHYHSGYPDKLAFSVVHMVKQEPDHPNLWFKLDDMKIDDIVFEQDDVVIFPCLLYHGVDVNTIDSNRITFVFDFTVEECSS